VIGGIEIFVGVETGAGDEFCILRFCPTFIKFGFEIPFAFAIASGVVPYCDASLERVSPAFIV
jgi:hypothetical protein